MVFCMYNAKEQMGPRSQAPKFETVLELAKLKACLFLNRLGSFYCSALETVIKPRWEYQAGNKAARYSKAESNAILRVISPVTVFDTTEREFFVPWYQMVQL